MPDVLLIYSTVDGHTREICDRLLAAFDSAGLKTTVEELTPATTVDPATFDAVVIGASIRYGKNRPEVAHFIETHKATLDAMPSAFFSVNAVARKPEKQTPETNPYVRKFLESISWRPKLIGIFAGKIDYPSYRFIDKHMIRLIMWITKGPTDLSGTFEFTNWASVDAFGDDVLKLVAEPGTGSK